MNPDKCQTMSPHFKIKTALLILLFSTGVSALFSVAHAQPLINGFSIVDTDWELACDNTGTCRAAGYTAEPVFDQESAWMLSVLLTRNAGAHETISGEMLIRGWDENQPPLTFNLWVGDKNYGLVDYKNSENSTALTETQVQALLEAAKTNEVIAFDMEGDKGFLSNQGMYTVLLKMDEFQKRTNTTGATINKGIQSEFDVLQPQPIPALTVPHIFENNDEQKQYYLNQKEKLIALTQLDYEQKCNIEDEEARQQLSIIPLNEQHALLSRLCWAAAYNIGEAFWLIDQELNSIKFITNSASYDDKGQIFSIHKARGLGDCWVMENYAWDGKQVIMTSSGSTGLCKGQPGGFWNLPTTVYNVVNLNNQTQ